MVFVKIVLAWFKDLPVLRRTGMMFVMDGVRYSVF